MTSNEKRSSNLTVEVQIVCGKFQRFNVINRCIEILKLVEFSKISIKIKNCKTFFKAQTANCLKKFIQPPIHPTPPTPPHQNKPYYVWKIDFLKEIYRNIQTFAFKVLQECSFLSVKKWCSANTFSGTIHKQVCWKIC